MPSLPHEWHLPLVLGTLALAAFAGAVWGIVRDRCPMCRQWRALVRVDRRTFPDGSVEGRFRCRYCGCSSWQDETPRPDPDHYAETWN